MNLMFLKSRILFKNGMSDEADLLLKEIMSTAIAEENDLYAGSAYHLLAASYLQSSCFDKADFCGRKAFAYYSKASRSEANTQELLEILASSALLQNDSAEADRLVAEIAVLKDRPDARYSSQRYVTIRAEHHLMRGEYHKARELLLEARDASSSSDENWYVINLQLGVASYHLCDWQSALSYDQTAIETPSRRMASISQTSARLAIAHHFLGHAEEAEKRMQIAEFSASQIRNDFDLIDAQRTLSECLLLKGDFEHADAVARNGVAIGLRHAATYPVLTLLMVLVEAAVIREELPRARFFLSEADLLLDRGVLVRPRDVMMYHFYRATLTDAPPPGEREAAAETMNAVLECLSESAHVAAFLKTRRYAAIHAELSDDSRSG
jgi:tetratricopeptide (TPR) repeat protein